MWILIILFTIINALFNFLKARWSAEASEDLAKSLKDKMYNHIQQLSLCIINVPKLGI